jgi:stage V sporulation protein R
VRAFRLPPELAEERRRIAEVARGYGLDFFDTVFEMVTTEQINTIASYDGFPVRYRHWRFGMAYDRIEKSSSWGLSKIYELVINNDPCYAYLLQGNLPVDQKLVMAHVYGHCDFFKNNAWFAPTNRHMVDELASHAVRIEAHTRKNGLDAVEKFLDACLSIENLIDIYAPYSPQSGRDQQEEQADREPVRFDAKPYMESFINPPEFLKSQQKEIDEQREARLPFPERPERDVMGFLMQYAPLRPWQKDVISMVREEAYYFAPQRLTKIMNEGWASYWHSRMMTEHLCDPSDILDFAERHAGAMAMQGEQVNPYKLGIELYRDIEDRWNKGRFGKEYDECEDLEAKRRWDTGLGEGQKKIFEVRQTYNDVTFVDTFLTPKFCEEQKLFTYAFNPKTGRREVTGRDFKEIKAKLLQQLANGGQPIIEVVDGNFGNRGELVLKHRHDELDLDIGQSNQTMEHLHTLWTRPVHIDTILDGKPTRLSYDGEKHETEAI